MKEVLSILTQDNDEGQRLRQSDPFVGILTEKERLRFLHNYEPGIRTTPVSIEAQTSLRLLLKKLLEPRLRKVRNISREK